MNYRTLCIAVWLLLSTALQLRAQNTYEGQVIDKTTEIAIPNVTVVLQKTNQATKTSEQGYFKITADAVSENDTLVFSYVGYKTLKLGVKNSGQQLFVTLEPDITQLKEVEINAGKAQDKVLNKFSWVDLSEEGNNKMFIQTHEALARLFEAPQTNSRLINIKIGRRQINWEKLRPEATESKYARFFVHVYAIDSTTRHPGQILLTKELVLLDKAKMITLDLSKEHLIIPGREFFIGIEWINNPFNETVQMLVTNIKERARLNGRVYDQTLSAYWISYQPFLVGYSTNNPRGVIWYKKEDKWMIWNLEPDLEIALSATIRY
ncbi:carboxypeptidase-like regulatory domain-containing protein [Mucilaginibacter corticis]|nr:carboxypeptidase-like regulatory domain-containing protein [Mucilaginibacter corticis]